MNIPLDRIEERDRIRVETWGWSAQQHTRWHEPYAIWRFEHPETCVYYLPKLSCTRSPRPKFENVYDHLQDQCVVCQGWQMRKHIRDFKSYRGKGSSVLCGVYSCEEIPLCGACFFGIRDLVGARTWCASCGRLLERGPTDAEAQLGFCTECAMPLEHLLGIEAERAVQERRRQARIESGRKSVGFSIARTSKWEIYHNEIKIPDDVAELAGLIQELNTELKERKK